MDIDPEALQALADTLPSRTFIGADEGPYLTRYILCKLPDRRQVNLHFFHRSDEDVQLHNHPWPGRSLILTGGYVEERLVDGEIRAKTFLPGDVSELRPDTFHRVDLLEPEKGCWTLFTLGPKEQTWGFLERDLNTFTPWREFIAAKGLVPV
jgi:hypothetical protein